MDYIDRITLCLKNGRKTQRGLARAIGTDATIVNKIIKRTRKMQDDEFVAAAQYLGVSVNWLMTGEEKMVEPSQKYSDVIAKLIMETSLAGKNPAKAVHEATEKFIRTLVSDEIKQGIMLDLEKYKRLVESLSSKGE
jgi:hypothetical protein